MSEMSSSKHQCPECGKSYSTQELLQYHYTVEHTNDSAVCFRCKKLLPTSQILSRHLSAHVSDIHSCNFCGLPCKTLVNLYAHLTTVHKYGNYQYCDVCRLMLSSRQALVSHINSKHENTVASLEQSLELCCGIHSAVNYPDEDMLPDARALLRPTIRQLTGEDQARWVEVPGQKEGAFNDNGLASAETGLIGEPQVRFPSTDYSHSTAFAPPDTVAHSPLRELNVLDPTGVLNKASVAESTQYPEKSRPDHPKLKKVISVPTFYLSLNPHSSRDEDKYICEVCGMKFKDKMSFVESHISSDWNL